MKVLYTGSFNPFHNGHQYVYDKACKYFGKDNVYIGLGINSQKESSKEQQEFLKWTLAPITKNVIAYQDLTAKTCQEHNIDVIVRGIRPGKSLEYEEDLMYWNQKLGGAETIFIPTPPEINQISSSVIRDLLSFNADVSQYINKHVLARWKKGKRSRRNIYFGKSCCGKSTYLKTIMNNHILVDCDKEIWELLKEKDIDMTEVKGIRKNRFNNIEFSNILIKVIEEVCGSADNFDEFISCSANSSILLRKLMKETVFTELSDVFDICLDVIIKTNVFEDLLNYKTHIDAAAIGVYFDSISPDILANFNLVKISTSDKNRERFREQRSISKEDLNKLDSLYRDPDFWDNEIIIRNPDFWDSEIIIEG